MIQTKKNGSGNRSFSKYKVNTFLYVFFLQKPFNSPKIKKLVSKIFLKFSESKYFLYFRNNLLKQHHEEKDSEFVSEFSQVNHFIAWSELRKCKQNTLLRFPL